MAVPAVSVCTRRWRASHVSAVDAPRLTTRKLADAVEAITHAGVFAFATPPVARLAYLHLQAIPWRILEEPLELALRIGVLRRS